MLQDFQKYIELIDLLIIYVISFTNVEHKMKNAAESCYLC